MKRTNSHDPTRPQHSSILREFLGLTGDLILPLAAYYTLRSFGVEPLMAMVLTVVPTAAVALYEYARERTINDTKLFALLMISASSVIALFTGSVRFLFALRSSMGLVLGAGFLLSVRAKRPLIFTLALRGLQAAPFLRRKLYTDSWNELWEREEVFRQAWRKVTVWWGVTQVFDACQRAIMAYTLPIDVFPLYGAVSGLTITFALWIGQIRYFSRSGVWQLMKESAVPPPPPESRQEPVTTPSASEDRHDTD